MRTLDSPAGGWRSTVALSVRVAAVTAWAALAAYLVFLRATVL